MLKFQHYFKPLTSFALETLSRPKVVEAADVKFDELAITASPRGRNLHMSGLVFHSGLAVCGIDSREDGDAVIVEIKLARAKPGLSGSFQADIPLLAGTKRVLFGRELTPVWENAVENIGVQTTTA